jgi:hypothetical protein
MAAMSKLIAVIVPAWDQPNATPPCAIFSRRSAQRARGEAAAWGHALRCKACGDFCPSRDAPVMHPLQFDKMPADGLGGSWLDPSDWGSGGQFAKSVMALIAARRHRSAVHRSRKLSWL